MGDYDNIIKTELFGKKLNYSIISLVLLHRIIYPISCNPKDYTHHSISIYKAKPQDKTANTKKFLKHQLPWNNKATVLYI